MDKNDMNKNYRVVSIPHINSLFQSIKRSLNEKKWIVLNRKNLSKILLSLGYILLAVSGYFLTYQLFFTQTPLSMLDLENAAAKYKGINIEKQSDFRYEGVTYFRGWEISTDNPKKFNFYVPRILPYGKPSIEVFLETNTDHNVQHTGNAIGTLWITGKYGNKVSHILSDAPLQRFIIPWTIVTDKKNSLEFSYAPISSDSPKSIVFATNIVRFNVIGTILICFTSGLILILYAPNLSAINNKNFTRPQTNSLWLLGLILFAFYLHSGAFISNDMFFGHEKISSAGKYLRHLLNDGQFAPRMYRELGVTLIPLITLYIEQTDRILNNGFLNIYPTSRYVMFVIMISSILILAVTTNKIFGRGITLLLSLLSIAHFPFIIDLYIPDVDAYFIPLFPLILAVTIRIIFGYGSLVINLIWLTVIMAFIGTLKVSGAYFIITIPLALLVWHWNNDRWKAIKLSMILIVVFSASYKTGNFISGLAQHPERHIGIEGVPFQETVVWHMLWAANGLFDSDTAHNFTKSGKQRNERVAAITGLKNTTYLRQSQIATEQVYKPGVIQAFKERPGFFYSNAFLRAHESGIKFFRYTKGKIGSVQKWLTDDNHPQNMAIQNQSFSPLNTERTAIRYGDAWKIAPLIFLGKVTQSELSFLADLLLIILAITGVFLIPNRALKVMILLPILIQFAFSTGIHSMNRYFMHVDFALLFGLSVFLHRIYLILEQAEFPLKASKDQDK